MIIALSWWFIIFTMRKNTGNRTGKDPAWAHLVRELESSSNSWMIKRQLDDYLQSNQEKVKRFETDYSFLVAYNSAIRQIKERLTA
jgi:hypothetical protein